MELEYIGKVLPDGHLSIDPFVAGQIKKGQNLKIRIEVTTAEYKPKQKLSMAAQDYLNFIKRNVHQGGYQQQEISREFIHEDAV